MRSSAKQELQPVEQRGEAPKLENDFSIIFHIIIIALALTIRHLHGSSKWFVVMMIAVVFCFAILPSYGMGGLSQLGETTSRSSLRVVLETTVNDKTQRCAGCCLLQHPHYGLLRAWQSTHDNGFNHGNREGKSSGGTKILQTHIFFANIPPFITCRYMLYGEWEHNTNLDLICPRAADGKIT